MWNKLKIFLWRIVYSPKYRIRYYMTYKDRNRLNVLNSENTIKHIIENKCSVSRMGDGEFQMMTHFLSGASSHDYKIDTFQGYDRELGQRLLEVYKSVDRKHLLCIPYAFKDSSVYKGYERIFFEREWLECKDMLLKLEQDISDRILGDACCSRFYMSRCDIKNYPAYIESLKKIWDRRDVVIVEGDKSRLGYGNDFFNNAQTISRILCPAVNAFDKYDRILSAILKLPKDKLVLIALGHTATVLAYDLSKHGYWAIDVGHIDVEYEWYLMKTPKKVSLAHKYVNEVKEGRCVSDLYDNEYLSQVIDRIA